MPSSTAAIVTQAVSPGLRLSTFTATGSGPRGSASGAASTATFSACSPGSTPAYCSPSERVGICPAGWSIGRITVAVT